MPRLQMKHTLFTTLAMGTGWRRVGWGPQHGTAFVNLHPNASVTLAFADGTTKYALASVPIACVPRCVNPGGVSGNNPKRHHSMPRRLGAASSQLSIGIEGFVRTHFVLRCPACIEDHLHDENVVKHVMIVVSELGGAGVGERPLLGLSHNSSVENHKF